MGEESLLHRLALHVVSEHVADAFLLEDFNEFRIVVAGIPSHKNARTGELPPELLQKLADMDQAEGCAVRSARGVLHKARNAVDGDEDRQVRNIAVVAVELSLILIAVQRYRRAVHIDDDAVFVAALFEDSDGFILREIDEIHDGRGGYAPGIGLFEFRQNGLVLGELDHLPELAAFFKTREEARQGRGACDFGFAQCADEAPIQGVHFSVIEIGQAHSKGSQDLIDQILGVVNEGDRVSGRVLVDDGGKGGRHATAASPIHEGGQACEPCYIFLIKIECNGAIEVVDVVAILHGEASGEFFVGN